MKYKPMKNEDSSAGSANNNEFITYSFDQSSKLFIDLNHKLKSPEYKAYGVHNVNKVKTVVDNNANSPMAFWKIYKSPRNALSDAASCMHLLNKDCKAMCHQPHVIGQIYALKRQFSQLLYEDHKCIAMIMQNCAKTELHSDRLPLLVFDIIGNTYSWHIPEEQIPFMHKIAILGESFIRPPSYYSKRVGGMNFTDRKALVRWVINHWNEQSTINKYVINNERENNGHINA